MRAGYLDLVEICCSKHSSLAECAEKSSLKAERWGLFNDWNFDKDETVTFGKKEIEHNNIRRFWTATPCTGFCGTQDINWARWDDWGKYLYMQRYFKARRLNYRVMQVVLHGLDVGGSETDFDWEWPRYSRSW